MYKNVLKSTGAVLAGFLSVIILSVGTDAVLEKAGIFPSQNEPFNYTWWMLLLALIFRSAYAVAGGYIAAALAPDRPMRHTVILGVIGFVFAVMGSAANWGKTAPSSEWYPILLVALTLPCVLLGGRLKTGTEKKVESGKQPPESSPGAGTKICLDKW